MIRLTRGRGLGRGALNMERDGLWRGLAVAGPRVWSGGLRHGKGWLVALSAGADGLLVKHHVDPLEAIRITLEAVCASLEAIRITLEAVCAPLEAVVSRFRSFEADPRPSAGS